MSDIAIPRNTLLLLIIALASSLILHTQHLPVWFYAIGLFVLSWRGGVYFGLLSFPGRIAKFVTVVVATYGVYEAFDRQVSLEGSAAFLVAAGLLKVLEMVERRDAAVLVYIALFLQATGFLFDQSIYAV